MNVIYYKFGTYGPEIVYCENSLEDRIALSSGPYFYAAIRQGSHYTTGLFGPIPFRNQVSANSALIYAMKIPDTSRIDPRLEQHNYFLIALVTSPKKAALIDRINLENALNQITSKILTWLTLLIAIFQRLQLKFEE